MNKLYILPLLLVIVGAYFFYSTPTPAQSSATLLADATPLKVQANPADSLTLKANQQAGRVSGEVTYTQRVTLTDNAFITVQLLDITRTDVPAIVVSEQTVQSEGRQVPIPFELNYDPNAINPNGTYNLFARITLDGNLIFVRTSPCLVITKGRPTTVKIVLSAATGARSNQITGKITYPDDIQLPANAIVTVQLVDISKQDSPANVRGEQTIQTNGPQKPSAYEIKYNPNTIRRSDYYIVRATITVDSNVLFTTKQRYRVLTHGYPKKANLTLSKVNP